MRSLYERAWSVVVWLGEKSDKSDSVCDDMANMKISMKLDGSNFVDRELYWKPLMKLPSWPYWTRLWII
jgi:hypothetical protein